MIAGTSTRFTAQTSRGQVALVILWIALLAIAGVLFWQAERDPDISDLSSSR